MGSMPYVDTIMNNERLNLCGIADPLPPILDEISKLLSQQKLVPFFGAGASRQHLGFDGAGLAHEIAKILVEPPETLLSELADHYEDRYGPAVFVEFLKSNLSAKAFDDS